MVAVSFYYFGAPYMYIVRPMADRRQLKERNKKVRKATASTQ